MEPRGRNRVERRLAAILAADVAGYSRLIEADEEGTLGRLKALRATVIGPKIAAHRGRIVKTTGDGLLVEFASVVDALRCATELQAEIAQSNTALPPDHRIEFRIGIHQGDIVVENDDIFGDGVNIAARLEGLAEPGGICVSARVQEDAAGRLDLAFEDMGEQALKNIVRPVRVFRIRAALTHPDAKAPGSPLSCIAGEGAERRRRGAGEGSPPLPLPDNPSIAVLPFANLSGDPEQEYFADGMVEEIITALSRIRWLFVIARNSSFTYKGRMADVKQIGRELGVRYLLEGSIRKAGNRVRITAQLVETEAGAHVWADRFDGSLEDIFELQDQVARSVAGIIEPALQAAEIRRSAARPTTDITAYDFYLRSLAIHFPVSKESVSRALSLLEQAIAIDPRYGRALSWAAVCLRTLTINRWTEEPDASRRKAVDLARRALQVTDNDPGILGNAAIVLAEFGKDIGVPMALVDRALALNPSDARCWYASGVVRLWAGEPDPAILHVETSLRLSPRERIGTSLSRIGEAQFFQRRFDEAASTLALSIEETPGAPVAYRFLAACDAHLGRLDEAREIVAQLRTITSVVVPNHLPYRKPEHRELLLSGLRLALGEET